MSPKNACLQVLKSPGEEEERRDREEECERLATAPCKQANILKAACCCSLHACYAATCMFA